MPPSSDPQGTDFWFCVRLKSVTVHSRFSLIVGPGCHLMASPASFQECSPAEDLHSFLAHQYSVLETSLTAKLNVWNLAS